MTKLKPGDKVRRTTDNWRGVRKGEIYTVAGVNSSLHGLSLVEDPSYMYSVSFFEKVEEPLEVEEPLKVGDRVKVSFEGTVVRAAGNFTYLSVPDSAEVTFVHTSHVTKIVPTLEETNQALWDSWPFGTVFTFANLAKLQRVKVSDTQYLVEGDPHFYDVQGNLKSYKLVRPTEEEE